MRFHGTITTGTDGGAKGGRAARRKATLKVSPATALLGLLAITLAGRPVAEARPRNSGFQDPSYASTRALPPTALHLGIELAPMTRDLRRFFGAPSSLGVLVMRVDKAARRALPACAPATSLSRWAPCASPIRGWCSTLSLTRGWARR